MALQGVYTALIQVNPGANAIFADTGPCEIDDTHDMTVMVSSTVACIVFLERRDAANANNVWSHAFPISANQPFAVHIGNVIVCLQNERFRLRLNGGITGQAQGTIVIG